MNRISFALFNEQPIRFREKEWNEDRAECITNCFYLLRHYLTRRKEIDNFLYEQCVEIVSDSGDVVSEYTLSIKLNGR